MTIGLGDTDGYERKEDKEMKRNEEEKRRALSEANEAKNRLAQIANKLEELGYARKAKSCMTLVYQIEEWQNRS